MSNFCHHSISFQHKNVHVTKEIVFTFNLNITSTTKATLSLTKFMVSIQGASSQNIIFSTSLYMRESFFWTVDLRDFFSYPYAPAGYFFSKLPGASLKLLNIVFENSLPKRIFWWKKKNFKFFDLPLDSRQLLTMAL